MKSESPLATVKLLRALKSFFTFKELGELLGIPPQALWRYTSLRVVPERATSARIMERIQALGLIDKILDEIVKVNKYGYVETWVYASNVSFLHLAGYLAALFVGDSKVDIVIAATEDAAPLATVVAEWLGADLCIVKHELDLSIERFFSETYLSRHSGRVATAFIPKDIPMRGRKALVVDNVVTDGEVVRAVARLVEKAGGKVWGFFAVAALGDAWRENLERTNVQKVKVLKKVVSPSPATVTPREVDGG